MGAIFDSAKIEAAGGVEALEALPAGSPELEAVVRYASVESFQSVTLVPLVLLVAFGLIALYDKVKAGR
jgi:hypothetical protein